MLEIHEPEHAFERVEDYLRLAPRLGEARVELIEQPARFKKEPLDEACLDEFFR